MRFVGDRSSSIEVLDQRCEIDGRLMGMRFKIMLLLAATLCTLAMPNLASADTIDRGSCSAGSTANTGNAGCSFALTCGTSSSCLYETRLHVSGVGIVGARLTVTIKPRCFDVLCGIGPTIVRSDNCQHITSCDAAVAGRVPLESYFTPMPEITVSCVGTGPAILEKVTCTGLTD
jgi:hypothetical protein